MLYNSHAKTRAEILNNEPPLKARMVHGTANDGSDWKGYQWPATRLTVADMRKLTELRNKTGRPITMLLHDAVSALYEILRDRTPNAENVS